MSLPLATARPDDPADWRWQARQSVRTLEGLERHLDLSDVEREGVRRALRTGLPLAITPYYLGLCDRHDARCPIRLQCVPRAEEALEVEGDRADPLGEEEHTVAPHLIRRYPDRALLLATDHCAVYCRFCTRSRLVGAGVGARPLEALEPAFAWLARHPEIHDVIVSGGDPGLLASARIAALLERLSRIESVGVVRFATRVPVTLPQRVTVDLCAALRRHPCVWVMTHFNHPKELTPEALAACARLADAGLPVMNQTVLLRGVNDDAATLARLFRGLSRARVRPYYLLQADLVRGTAHLRTPLSRGIEIMSALQGHVSGLASPKLVVDTPAGRGKVVIGPDTLVAREGRVTVLRTFRGELVRYVDPPGDDAGLHAAPDLVYGAPVSPTSRCSDGGLEAPRHGRGT